jgi:hypothetical protein
MCQEIKSEKRVGDIGYEPSDGLSSTKLQVARRLIRGSVQGPNCVWVEWGRRGAWGALRIDYFRNGTQDDFYQFCYIPNSGQSKTSLDLQKFPWQGNTPQMGAFISV